jgi:hypothetical protein
MIVVAFSLLLIMAVLSGVFHVAMRIRLMKMDSARDRIEWLGLRGGGDDVLETYEALFPKSVLPRFCRLAFWTVVVCAAVALCLILTHRALGR